MDKYLVEIKISCAHMLFELVILRAGSNNKKYGKLFLLR